jgi:putative transposase
MLRISGFNVWSADEERERLKYIHRNPVQRGLVTSPQQWKGSSFRHYAFRERGVVKMPEPTVSFRVADNTGG